MIAREDYKKILSVPVIVVALGYFVDIFDLTLFSMLRTPSLVSLGVPADQLVDVGIRLLNTQMIGMLIGGVLWGVLGDKKGRLKVLFGSILLYSLANILNGFVQSVEQYQALRFLSGLGLAGELGAGITLISEILPQKIRGLGTTVVATIGVAGAVFGGIFIEYFDWRTCFMIGGVLGILLLFLRLKVQESLIFKKSNQGKEKWGSLRFAFSDLGRIKKFVFCIFMGAPIWYVAGLVMGFAPELSKALGVQESILSSRAIAISYLGLAIGDFLSGVLSQKLQSRLKAVRVFIFFTVAFLVLLFTTVAGCSETYYYFLCLLIGIGAGFWALFVTVAAEQFGSNIRATMATSIPNFVRGAVVPMTLAFKFLKPEWGFTPAMITVGAFVFALSLLSTFGLEETFHKTLDYVEE